MAERIDITEAKVLLVALVSLTLGVSRSLAQVKAPKKIIREPIFSDDFSSGLSKWSIKGSPLPSIVSAEGNPSPAFCNNDDLNYGGYAVSKQTFKYLNCDFEVSIDVKQGNASFPDQRFSSVYLVKSNVLGGTNAQPRPAEFFLTITLTGNSYGQTPGWGPPPANGPWFRAQIVYDEGSGELWEDSGIIPVPDGDGWHNIRFKVRIKDRKVEFYLDKDLLYTSSHQIVSSYDGIAAIALGHRLCYHDNVIVISRGVAPVEVKAPKKIIREPIFSDDFKITSSESLLDRIKRKVKETYEVWAGSGKREEYYVKSGRANIRKDPTIKSTIIASVPQNTKVLVVKAEGQWLKVKTLKENITGWMHKETLSKYPMEPPKITEEHMEPRKITEVHTEGKKQITIETDIAPAIDRKTEYERSKDESREQVAKQSAEYAVGEARSRYEKVQGYRNRGIYQETRNILNEAKINLDDAQNYLDIGNYSEASRYAELARGKFYEVEKIAKDIDRLWTSLEEKLPYLNTKICQQPSVFSDEQNRLLDEASHLYYDAKNILRTGTFLQGGFPSKGNLRIAEKKINRAFELAEKAARIARDALQKK